MPKHIPSKCPHNKRKSRCAKCGGSSICKHGRIKTTCRPCGGSDFCIHSRQKAQCKQCNGSAICQHRIQRAKCKLCNGSAICEHSQQKAQCLDCNGTSICEHNRQRATCVPCHGSQICEHNKQRRYCETCDPLGYLTARLRKSLRSALDRVSEIKDSASLAYFGVESFDDLRSFLQSKIDIHNATASPSEQMEFKNIVIDHIRPVAEFKRRNITADNELANHYTNLQPLFPFDNGAKSDKWNSDDEIFWRENIIKQHDFRVIYNPYPRVGV